MTTPRVASRPFLRDVAVNVFGGLITAGILYVLAAAGDYIAAKPWLITAAVALIATYGVAFLEAWLSRSRYADQLRAVLTALHTVGVTGVGLVIVSVIAHFVAG